MIEFYTKIVGLTPLDKKANPSLEKWYGFDTGKTQFAIEPLSNRDKYTFKYNKSNPTLIQFKAKTMKDLKEWTERLIADLNKHLSERDITTAKQKIRFLNSQISKTSESRLQSVLYDMIAEQMEILVLAEQPVNYAFTVIDPPIVPIERFKPNRTRYIAAGVLLGLVLALGASLAQYTYSRNKRRTSLHS